jgi:methylated-DNA-[protein]-cysteine S-methyltransferase
MNIHHHVSPAGYLEIKSRHGAITELRFVEPPITMIRSKCSVIEQCCRELDEYFGGKRKRFDVKIAPEGTAFQKKVWEQLQKIEYGKTDSYSGLAEAIGQTKACRAVGSANGKNPIAIIIPCHRVIAANGSLGGYAYGLDRKRYLLNLERI